MTDIDFENKFWLQVLGDHCRFIEVSLADKEEYFLNNIKIFKKEADSLLKKVHSDKTNLDAIKTYITQLLSFKQELLEKHLTEKLHCHYRLPLLTT